MSTPASPAHPVLWHEGLFLAPQHFQQTDRHARWRLARLVAALSPHAWGVSRLAFDTQALAAGIVRLVHAEGVMPDGEPFSLGADDEPPPARQVVLPAGTSRLAVHLAIAVDACGTSVADTGVRDGRATRRRRVQREVRDDADGPTRELALAAPAWRLVLGDEPLDGSAWIALADVGAAPAGGLMLLDDRCPPCLRIGAVPALHARVRRCAESAAARAGELADRRRGRAGQVEIAGADTAAYLALLALGAHVPALAAMARDGDAHPSAAHAELARLVGALCAVSADGDARELPGYRHDAPLDGIAALVDRLLSLLDAIAPGRCAALPARRPDEHVVAATLPDAALDDARLFLAVRSDLPAERIMRELPARSRVGALGRLDALVAQSLRGLRLTWTAVPPVEVPARPGWSYFEVGRDGDEWRHAREARSLAAWLPPEHAATAEFLAVRG